MLALHSTAAPVTTTTAFLGHPPCLGLPVCSLGVGRGGPPFPLSSPESVVVQTCNPSTQKAELGEW
jgi:hypothetical protein